jgi:hypothetical protein
LIGTLTLTLIRPLTLTLTTQAIDVDFDWKDPVVVVQKKGNLGLVVEAVEHVTADHVVVNKVGETYNKYPMKKTYLAKNYKKLDDG